MVMVTLLIAEKVITKFLIWYALVRLWREVAVSMLPHATTKEKHALQVSGIVLLVERVVVFHALALVGLIRHVEEGVVQPLKCIGLGRVRRAAVKVNLNVLQILLVHALAAAGLIKAVGEGLVQPLRCIRLGRVRRVDV